MTLLINQWRIEGKKGAGNYKKQRTFLSCFFLKGQSIYTLKWYFRKKKVGQMPACPPSIRLLSINTNFLTLKFENWSLFEKWKAVMRKNKKSEFRKFFGKKSFVFKQNHRTMISLSLVLFAFPHKNLRISKKKTKFRFFIFCHHSFAVREKKNLRII